jgi:flagellar biosynthetic protein FlhB
MLTEGLSFGPEAVRDFDPAAATLRLAGMVLLPVFALFALTLFAAFAAPALLGSLGFRAKAFGFKADKLNPIAGMKRIFSMNGLIELLKSIAKVIVLGAIGAWLLFDQSRLLIGLSAQEIGPALSSVGSSFVLAILVMALALALVAGIDVPAQIFQRAARLRMSKQEVKDEHKQTEGSPELKSAIRRRQHEVLRGSARSAVAEATVVLTNPTHFAVALRYRPGEDAAPIVVARGRGATAEAIRALAGESDVPILSYPQLARALYFTARTGQVIREDLYMAVATVLAFVFNLDAAVAAGTVQPAVDVPPGARFDEKGRPQA